jgi:hypothetical protein
MQRHLLVLTALMIALAGSASAGSVSFEVTIDTSSVAGAGGIYLSFAPGLNADPASVSITDFSPSAGLAGSPAFTDGGVSGSLDTNELSFTNYLFQLNDYGENVTFGSALSFEVTFQLPDILTGDSGSELDIQLTQSDLETPLLTEDPSGNIAEISYDQNGNFTENATSDFASITPVSGSATPEPATGGSAAMAALLVLGWLYRRPRRRI